MAEKLSGKNLLARIAFISIYLVSVAMLEDRGYDVVFSDGKDFL